MAVSKGGIVFCGGGLTVLPGGTLENNGLVFTAGDFDLNGKLSTDICGNGSFDPTTPGTAGTDFGQVTVTGTTNITANVAEIDVDLAVAQPATDQRYRIILSTNRVGNMPLESLPPGPAWSVDFSMAANVDIVFTRALPVTWLSFTGHPHAKGIDLRWATAAEDNTDYFAVERQHAAQPWQEIGRIAAAGTSQTTLEYDFDDRSPATGENLYRLRQVDLDGTFSYSDIVTANFRGTAESFLYPNPNDGVFTLGLPTENTGNFELFNAAGQLILSGRFADNSPQQELRLPGDLPAGTYHLRVGDVVQTFQLR